MPRDLNKHPDALDIAVIGSGVAGMGAAWVLSRAHRVTVYEREGRIGGHSHTIEVIDNGERIPVDTGFIVYNELNYPDLTALFAYLGVDTQPSEMSFAASLDNGHLEYSGSSLAGLFGQPRNLIRPRFLRMLRDIRRFYREGPKLLADDQPGPSLGEYLDRGGYSTAFIEDHLLPMAAAIWSTGTASMRSYPASAFIRFCLNHGLMQVSGRPQWRTVVGGSRSYVKRLTASFSDRIMTNAQVTGITRTPAGVLVEDANGATNRYDQVVIATHADQALAVLRDADDDEKRLLGAFRYSANTVFVHQDERLMPKRRRVWASWNYLGSSRRKNRETPLPADDGSTSVSVTYWMNRLQTLSSSAPIFVTLNPRTPPAKDKILRVLAYDHPMYDAAALQAQASLHGLQERRDTWFCGSYFGAGFHEDALTSALAIGERLGVPRPWLDGNGATDPLAEGSRSTAE